MIFESIMSVDEYVAYDITSTLDTLCKNQIREFGDLKYRCDLDEDYPYVTVWTKSEEEHLIIMYCNQANTIAVGYPNDNELTNVKGECFFESFEMPVKPPVIEPENLGKWQYALYSLIQKVLSKHIAGTLKDEMRKEFLTTVEL